MLGICKKKQLWLPPSADLPRFLSTQQCALQALASDYAYIAFAGDGHSRSFFPRK